MREGGLLNRQKRPHFIATWAYDTNRAGENQKQEIVREGESQTGSSLQNGADDEACAVARFGRREWSDKGRRQYPRQA